MDVVVRVRQLLQVAVPLLHVTDLRLQLQLQLFGPSDHRLPLGADQLLRLPAAFVDGEDHLIEDLVTGLLCGLDRTLFIETKDFYFTFSFLNTFSVERF